MGSSTGVFWLSLLTCTVMLNPRAGGAGPGDESAEVKTRISVGSGGTIVAVRPTTETPTVRADGYAPQTPQLPFPRPRLVGFSALVAITTSDERMSPASDDWNHQLHDSYVGSALNTPAWANYIVGFLDSGATANLVAGSFVETIGLVGAYLTENPAVLEGVGGTVSGVVSQPVGFFGAGISAISPSGVLHLDSLVGHSNVAAVAAPPFICGGEEVVSGVLGLPFMAFRNTIIEVDNPQRATVAGVTYEGPNVRFTDPFDALPLLEHTVGMYFDGEQSVVNDASYLPNFLDPNNPDLPWIPTILSYQILPVQGAFFATIHVLEGEPGPTNVAQPMDVLVDTGAQSSVMSGGMANALSLPLTPDFRVDVCGVGGVVSDVPAYYVDYVKISAGGGALEFSQAPFVVLDLNFPGIGVIDGILGMNFLWNRNVIFEPAVGRSATLHVSDPLPVPFGDSNVDFDVDLADAADFVPCMTRPGSGRVSPVCTHFDGDEDNDVDLIDARWLQLCMSGNGVPADSACRP